MTSTSTLLVQPGIVVSTAITAGGDAIASNHSEGILVSTAPQAVRGR